MTLIAMHGSPERALILTDSWAYSPTMRHILPTNKVVLLPHLDAAIALSGECDPGDVLRGVIQGLSLRRTSFDALWEGIDEPLRAAAALWDEEHPDRPMHQHVYMAGWSDREGRFHTVEALVGEGQVLLAATDEVLMQPAPPLYRRSTLSDVALRRFLVGLFEEGEERNTVLGTCDRTQQYPAMPLPSSDRGWVLMALQAHLGSSRQPLDSALKVLVGGGLWLTELTRGSTTHRRLDSIDPTNAALLEIFAGTMHPFGQIGACPCGSGRTYRTCCIPPLMDQPCTCNPTGDVTMRHCCALALTETVVDDVFAAGVSGAL